MNLRFFIFGFLLLSYSVIPGHEVIYGHHFSSDENCHHSSSDCCQNQEDTSGHLPCLLDINPHFGSSDDDNYTEHFESISPIFYAILNLDIEMLSVGGNCVPLPPGLSYSNFYMSPVARSNSLRGPPLA